MTTQVRGLSGNLSLDQREKFIESIPKVSAEDIHSLGKHDGHMRFRGSLASGAEVIFVPLHLESSWDIPRLLSVYATLSGCVNIQRFYGMFSDASGHYAVMEDVEGEGGPFVSLQKALSDNQIAKSSRIHKLRLCYEVALTVAYLHSLEIIVKVISESSIFVRNSDGGLVPVMANLDQTRDVFHILHSLADLTQALTHTNNFSVDKRYNPPEYANSAMHTFRTDIWRLGPSF